MFAKSRREGILRRNDMVSGIQRTLDRLGQAEVRKFMISHL